MAILDSINSVKQQIVNLGNQRAQLAAKLEKARQRREDLQVFPLPLDEHVDKMCRLVDSNAEQFSEHLKRRTDSYVNDPLNDMGHMLAFLVDGSQGDGMRIQHMVCGLFPDQVKEGLRRTAQTWAWPQQAGPPLLERKKEIAKLDKIIAGLESEIREYGTLPSELT